MSESTQAPEFLKPLKTWSYATGSRKKPSEYDIVSRNLHFHMNDQKQPFSFPNIPMSEWYIKYRNKSPMQHSDWDAFTDPDKIVYRTYNILQDGQETHVNSLFDQMDERGHDKMLSPEYAKTLARLYAPARYAYHTLQLGSAYIQQMAPSSTITNCATWQTGDALRALTHTAYRTHELGLTFKDVGFGNERDVWENDPAWQGIRELMEKALTAWDWAEAFVVINLIAKPALEESIQVQFASYAQDNNDTLLGLLSQSQYSDSTRHRKWASALVKYAVAEGNNKEYIQSIVTKWMPLANKAIETYCNEIPDSPDAASNAKEAVKDYLATLHLEA